MARITTRDYADLALGGELAALLREWREAGNSYDEIVLLLRARDITTSRETVRRWIQHYGTDHEAVA